MRHHADMRALRESEEGFRQGQRMEAVGRFAGGVAHDFNNMMSAVVGFSALVLDALPAGRSAARWVRRSSAQASERRGLTKQLLAFTRKQVLLPQVLDLNAVVLDVDELLAPPDRRRRRARRWSSPRPCTRSRPTSGSSSR